MEGVVVQSYGAGNGPDARDDLINLFKEASKRGVLIINITQCQRGVVTTSYATGKVRCKCPKSFVLVQNKLKALH